MHHAGIPTLLDRPETMVPCLAVKSSTVTSVADLQQPLAQHLPRGGSGDSTEVRGRVVQFPRWCGPVVHLGRPHDHVPGCRSSFDTGVGFAHRDYADRRPAATPRWNARQRPGTGSSPHQAFNAETSMSINRPRPALGDGNPTSMTALLTSGTPRRPSTSAPSSSESRIRP